MIGIPVLLDLVHYNLCKMGHSQEKFPGWIAQPARLPPAWMRPEISLLPGLP